MKIRQQATGNRYKAPFKTNYMTMKKVLLIFVFFTGTVLLQSQSVWTNVKDRGDDPWLY